MQLVPLRLPGAFQVELEPRTDERGHFARTFCAQEFAAAGLPAQFVQCNVSFNRKRGTLRGMHWQDEPRPEGKLVRCTRGAALDVIVDIRPTSFTYCQWVAVELTADSGRAVYVPPGFAHGFVTLADDTELFYQMTAFYEAGAQRGARWNDPAFGIDWPVRTPLVSARDAGFADFVR